MKIDGKASLSVFSNENIIDQHFNNVVSYCFFLHKTFNLGH